MCPKLISEIERLRRLPRYVRHEKDIQLTGWFTRLDSICTPAPVGSEVSVGRCQCPRQGNDQALRRFPSPFFGIRGSPNHSKRIPPDKPMMKGWRTSTPRACARAPTTKGRTAAPPPPNAAANPMALTCCDFGRSLVATTTTAGKKGPRKKPWRETATAEA